HLGLTEEADRNRFIILDLVRPDAESREKGMGLPRDEELARLGQKLLALAVRFGPTATKVAEAIKVHSVNNVPPRYIESYAVPAAMIAVSSGGGEEEAKKLLDEWLRARSFEGLHLDDEATLIRDIMHSSVQAGSERFPVAEIATQSRAFSLGKDALEG